jgi:hypothetical protein
MPFRSTLIGTSAISISSIKIASGSFLLFPPCGIIILLFHNGAAENKDLLLFNLLFKDYLSNNRCGFAGFVFFLLPFRSRIIFSFLQYYSFSITALCRFVYSTRTNTYIYQQIYFSYVVPASADAFSFAKAPSPRCDCINAY